MSKTKHTPGPWSTGEYTDGNAEPHVGMVCVTAIKSKNFLTEICAMPVRGRGRANARLIAAAPELLESLKKLFAEHRRIYPHHNHLCNDCKESERAIAKAEGRSLEHLRSDADWDQYFLVSYYPDLAKAEGHS